MKYKLLALLFISSIVSADFQVDLTRLNLYCHGGPIDERAWFLTQVMYDTEPMSIISDIEGHCPAKDDFVENATLINITDASQETLTLTLPNKNITYYTRVRTCYCWIYRDVSYPYEAFECYGGQGENYSWINLTHELLNEKINGDYSLVAQHLNCSSWRTEVPYRAEKIPEVNQ